MNRHGFELEYRFIKRIVSVLSEYFDIFYNLQCEDKGSLQISLFPSLMHSSLSVVALTVATNLLLRQCCQFEKEHDFYPPYLISSTYTLFQLHLAPLPPEFPHWSLSEKKALLKLDCNLVTTSKFDVQ